MTTLPRPPAGVEAALLAGIIDDPDDDRRLVFADWLDERGGPERAERAEFIRLQVAEAAMACQKNIGSVGTGRIFLSQRELALIRQRHQEWAAGLPRADGVGYASGSGNGGVDFERGFPWQVHAPSVEAFLAVAPRLFAAAPITYLHLGNLKIRDARELAASPHLERVRQWQDVYSRRTDKMLAEIAKSEHLGNLREVDLTGAPLTAAGVRALLTAPSLRRVTRLCLASCEIGDEGAEAVADSPACAELEHLNLTDRALTAAAVRALASSPLRLTMQSLLLSQTTLGDDAAAVLASARWPRMVYLCLDNNRIGDRGASALVGSPAWRESGSELWLAHNPISDGVKAELRAAFGARVRP
jgi:uncharacterized protein (TIGR02996 family)